LKQECAGIPLVTVLIPTGVPNPPNETLWSRFIPQLPDVLDLRQDLQNPAMFFDGAHLSVAGHALVGDRIAGKILPHLN
jgi:hypothetical protein